MEIHLAEYRNALAATPSPLTKNPLKAETINGRLVTVCQFYKFALKMGYVAQLPFNFDSVRVRRNYDADMFAHNHSTKEIEANELLLPTQDNELDIPTNKEIGRFISGLRNWRDKLIAEGMWFTGVRREEICFLNIHKLPEDPFSLTHSTHKVRIRGKGRKDRSVYFPVGWLRSVARYVELERNPRVRKHKVVTEQIWVSGCGEGILPATITKSFSTNAERCGINVVPHDLRRSYATNRLIYLEDHNVPVPYKIVQGELGHTHLSTTLRYIRYVERMRAEVVTSHGRFIDLLTEHIKQNEEE